MQAGDDAAALPGVTEEAIGVGFLEGAQAGVGALFAVDLGRPATGQIALKGGQQGRRASGPGWRGLADGLRRSLRYGRQAAFEPARRRGVQGVAVVEGRAAGDPSRSGTDRAAGARARGQDAARGVPIGGQHGLELAAQGPVRAGVVKKSACVAPGRATPRTNVTARQTSCKCQYHTRRPPVSGRTQDHRRSGFPGAHIHTPGTPHDTPVRRDRTPCVTRC